MKRLITAFSIILFFIHSCATKTKEIGYIRIKQVGVINKPTHEIVLSNIEMPEDSNLWYFNIVVPDSVLQRLEYLATKMNADTADYLSVSSP